ncbi:hypothetical protein E2C01_022289 [Portunus trituberculatus]|uniref:Uncharacterized protein n=1 Tax=Portunus trituberculatus TaxID=210409 RepID=A0A5B7E4Y9_PORTR|nr:hypothetical protein [Portunus trituberculatus]
MCHYTSGGRRQGWEVTVGDQVGPLDRTLYLSLLSPRPPPTPAAGGPAQESIHCVNLITWSYLVAPDHRVFAK